MLEAGKRAGTLELTWLGRLEITEELKSPDKRNVGEDTEEQGILVAVLAKS